MVQVFYRDFSPPFQDVVEGRIQVVATGLLPLLPFAREGKIKLLVLTNRERSPAAPELPTARAIGHPRGRRIPGLLRLARHAGELARPYRRRRARGRRGRGAKQKLAVLGQAVRTGTPADFVAMIEAQRAQIAAIAQAIGFQKQ